MDLKFAVAPTPPREVAPRTFRFVASTAEPDRDGDVIEARGWKLDTYLKNPVILVSHNHQTLPVARASRIWIETDRLMVDIQFPPEGTSEAADETYALVRDGFLRAVSVGFIPLQSTALPSGGRHHLRQELLEISLVSVPANPSAVLAAGLGKGVRMTEEQLRQAIRTVTAQVLKEQFKEKLLRLTGRLD